MTKCAMCDCCEILPGDDYVVNKRGQKVCVTCLADNGMVSDTTEVKKQK